MTRSSSCERVSSSFPSRSVTPIVDIFRCGNLDRKGGSDPDGAEGECGFTGVEVVDPDKDDGEGGEEKLQDAVDKGGVGADEEYCERKTSESALAGWNLARSSDLPPMSSVEINLRGRVRLT
jgi:hypothetical protein